MKICGIEYTLEYLPVQEINDKYGKEHDDVIFGYTDFVEQKIYIGSDLKPDGQCETLLHEILEAIDNHSGLNLKHRQIYGMSNAIFSFLKENEDFFNILQGVE